MSTMVFSYPCRIIEGADLVAEQISAAHRYYNRLVELHRERRESRHKLVCEMCPDYDAAHTAYEQANAEVERVVDAIKAANAKAKRKRATPTVKL